MKSNIFLFLVSLLFLSFVMIAGLMSYGYFLYQKPGPLEAEKPVVIERGSGVRQIAGILENEQVIESALIFKIAARLTKKHTMLKAGEYVFAPETTLKDALNAIAEGKTRKRKFTIPEGLTSYQIVQTLNDIETLEGDIADIPVEGCLLPETYFFALRDSRAEKVERMQDAMRDVLEEAWQNRAENLPLKTKKEALVLASIIEKETGVGGERRKVAGVFINRLRKGMPLQSDPTVIYALTKGKVEDEGYGPLGRRLLRKDLKIDSPYNTYRYPGLPPGPIANPGKASIEAALNPAEHDYFYFVADGTGGHAFGRTLAEHNRNVAKWRRIRARQ